MSEEFIFGIQKRVAESASPLDIFLLEILNKISEKNGNCTITVAAPNAQIAELAINSLTLKGFHASSYNNIVSVYIQ